MLWEKVMYRVKALVYRTTPTRDFLGELLAVLRDLKISLKNRRRGEEPLIARGGDEGLHTHQGFLRRCRRGQSPGEALDGGVCVRVKIEGKNGTWKGEPLLPDAAESLRGKFCCSPWHDGVSATGR